LDSCALLHLLRCGAARPCAPGGGYPLVAAHFDHRMRPGSDGDARWVRGLCAAWRVELISGAAQEPPATEEAAREARYAFLEEARRACGARAIVTAHHADDQAETVLFRMLRGTGLAGLRGIHPLRDGRVWRPLLEARRGEIRDYAAAVGLSWREDPTNARTDFARNALRHRIIPEAERHVAPAAVPALARLAAAAAHDEEGWESLLPGLLSSLDVVREGENTSLEIAGLARLHPAVRARVIRALARELGVVPGGAATAGAVAFVEGAASGRSVDLGAGLTLRRDLGRAVFARGPAHDPTADALPLIIPGPEPGAGEAVLGGRSVRVVWGRVPPTDAPDVATFGAASLRFPLVVRGWAPGDRIRTSAGSRKLKKLFLEARIPEPLRHRVPVVSDASGAVLWAVGVARAVAPSRTRSMEPAGYEPMSIGVS
jgi:tRNA(Ile)-lysidine synthase